MTKRGISLYRKNGGKRGFTLIEMLTAVAILATLTSIAIPAFHNLAENTKKKTYLMEAYVIEAAVQEYMYEQKAAGTFTRMGFYQEVMSTTLGDEENALTEVLRGIYTPKSRIRGITYEIATLNVKGMIYSVDVYEIDIINGKEPEFRARQFE